MVRGGGSGDDVGQLSPGPVGVFGRICGANQRGGNCSSRGEK